MEPIVEFVNMAFQEFLKNICFVIVLYQRKPEESPAFRVLRELNETVRLNLFIYDNSPVGSDTSASFIIYQHDPGNSGVSKAYNEACRFAAEKKLRWLMLLDQDTTFDVSFFETLFVSVTAHPSEVVFVPKLYDKTGMISPFRWRSGRGIRIKDTNHRLRFNSYRFVNSGSLIRRDAFEKAGGYLESIPLDFSDIAFQERIRKTAEHFVVADIKLEHDFSGSARSSASKALTRFRFFCVGAVEMVKTFGRWEILASVLLRSLHLTIRYREMNFFKEGVKAIFLSKSISK